MTAEELLENVRQSGGEIWAVGNKLHYRLPNAARPLISGMAGLKPQLLDLLRPSDPEGWNSVFPRWVMTACVEQPRSFSDLGILWVSFCEACARVGVQPLPSRVDFVHLLNAADLLVADGLVSGLSKR
jgi:hypothetical protein